MFTLGFNSLQSGFWRVIKTNNLEMNFLNYKLCLFFKSYIWCLHEGKYTFQLIPRQSGNPQGPRSTRFKGAMRNICATTFNQLLGLTALMLLNCCRPRSSGVNHLLLLSETQDTCFHLLVYFQVITALQSTRPTAHAILLPCC